MAESDERKDTLLRRESRIQPTDVEGMVEYFLEGSSLMNPVSSQVP
eukprot:gene18934-25501_t